MLSNHGLTGLINLGNTCYMNSAIQCLSNTPELTHFFLSKEFQKNLDEDHKFINLINEWYRLIEAIWSDNCTIIPKTFDTTIKTYAKKYGLNQNFTNYGQNDVQEFLLFMIDNMHEVLSKKVTINISGVIQNEKDKCAYQAMKNWETHFKNSYSKIIEIFYGQLITTIETPDNKILSKSFDPICFYTLPIPSPTNNEQVTIYDCFDLFCSSELLTGDNQYYCDKKKEYFDAYKKTKIWKFSNIVIICLKRFNNNMRKICKPIDFPTTLDLNKYCEGYETANYYDLYGICNHSGGTFGGHYYAYCKNKNGNWYNYNDSCVTNISEEDIITSAAYCLFYRKSIL
jgi:ubiquitin carboxyl-terminal hydrolase 8